MRIETGRGWTMHLGDCLEIMATLDKVDHVITDPPYEKEAHTKERRVKRSGGVAVVEELTFPPMTEAGRIAAAAHFAALARRWTIVFCQVEAAMTWANAAKDGGAAIRRIGVWVKPDGQPQLSGDRPGMGYETIVFCHAPGRSKWHGGGRSSVFVHNKNDLILGAANSHPTQKPSSLMTELVSLFTDPGETVLDAFAGSGTTGVAAIRLGRRFIGIEKDPRYFELACERLRAEEQGTTLQAARAGQVSLFGGKQ